MKVSRLWLREWVNVSLSAQELADQLTMAGLEVDAVSPVAGAFTHVVVAEVLSTKPHPDADKLTLCEVNANKGAPLKIVCGASNVRPGLKVALAMIGAQLPDGLKIKESKLRGELSQGMLCSTVELGLSEQSDGILELEENAPVGVDLREYLALDDEILDIDLTPNRADCFSVLGVAREISVLNQSPLIEHAIPTITPVIDEVLTVELVNPEACPRYCGRVIRNINTSATTPVWMVERLRRSGIRTVHPVVDVMNYVMLELGQPMHAFDLQQIKGQIRVRYSNESESIELLDGQDVNLKEKVLLIADNEKALAMAGIMGGAHSAVQANTRDIFLESAYFNPIIIAGIARKYGLFSDSSQRYERGIDPCLQIKALERATALIIEIVGGEAGPVIESKNTDYLPSTISFIFDTSKVKKLTGLSIGLAEMKDLLQGLGIIVSKETGGLFDVTIPSHRVDLQQDVDLVEEIIRLFGYDSLQAEPMHAEVQPGVTSKKELVATQVASWFKTKGYNETISYSFVDPELQEELYPGKQFMQLLNPISSELSQMRAGMWPGLLASMIYNIHRQQTLIKFYEIGVVFDLENGKLKERSCFACLLTGEKGSLNWNESTRAFDFYDLKGDLQSMLSSFRVEKIEFKQASHHALHPGQSAQIYIDGKPEGWIGVLHPRLADALDISQDVILMELNLEVLAQSIAPLYKTISKYPQIRRDLSFLVDQKVNASQIEQAVRSSVTENWLKSFDVFDVYTGKGIPEGKKSIAVAMTLQDEGKTLVDSEINLVISAIISKLENEFSIILRE